MSGRATARAGQLLGAWAQHDVPLGPLTTYKVGGAARLLVRVDDVEDLARVAQVAGETDVRVLVVGRGSNLLVSDAGFDGLVVTFGEAFATVTIEGTEVTAGAGAALPVVARRSATMGLAGLEWAVGVPGSVGGGVRMNAGGHGSDMAACVREVRVFDLEVGHDVIVPVDRLGLSFRHSDLADHHVVISASFALAPADPAECEARLAEVVRWRREHQPGGQNAGSVFVNPVPGELAAGQLIDQLGLRGLTIGTAYVSDKHANFIQATEGGRADDVHAVMVAVRQRVHEATGVWLRSEIRLVGFEPDRS